MGAYSKQLRHIEAAPRAVADRAEARDSDARSGGGPAALGVAALGFFCFMPYPALPVGGSTAIQMGNVLSALAAIPALVTGWMRRPTWLFVLVITPLCVSS